LKAMLPETGSRVRTPYRGKSPHGKDAGETRLGIVHDSNSIGIAV
jgi:hypothetical protein